MVAVAAKGFYLASLQQMTPAEQMQINIFVVVGIIILIIILKNRGGH